MIRATEGDRVRVIFTNLLPATTSIHRQGLPLPNDMGAACEDLELQIARQVRRLLA